MEPLFNLIAPEKNRVPILISCPHSGIEFPNEISDLYEDKIVQCPEDTDWFVDQIYDFASSLGITLIKANYSRYVIDLNRASNSKQLYEDGREETSLVPTKTFSGRNIYSFGSEPNQEEIQRRYEEYYQPYYNQVERLLFDLQKEFKNVLFFDAHSIKKNVPSLSKEPFPDLILGNNEQLTCADLLIEEAQRALAEGPWEVVQNAPFKGGNLTRFFGDPIKGRHSLQLEMSQTVYMTEGQKDYDGERACRIRFKLIEMFKKLIKILGDLP